jgi:hypothetical protein
MTVEEQDKLARQAVSAEMKLKDATAAHKSSFPAIGKVICVIEERLNDLKTLKKIASNTTAHERACGLSLQLFPLTFVTDSQNEDRVAGHFAVVVAAVGAEVAHTTDIEFARTAYFGIQTANDMFAQNVIVTKGADGKETASRRFSDEVMDSWLAAYNAAMPAPATPETPAESDPAADEAALNATPTPEAPAPEAEADTEAEPQAAAA